MFKVAKRFASQCARKISLSNNSEIIRMREISQFRIELPAEEHRIKTKFRTRLAHAINAVRRSSE